MKEIKNIILSFINYVRKFETNKIKLRDKDYLLSNLINSRSKVKAVKENIIDLEAYNDEVLQALERDYNEKNVKEF